ncbi:hypothetical protein O3P69_015572 [Scylla paramamosain]|uniref:HTH psq-type domain-containing protein n=1 Tax=Scylla paramamosain TaxID=85552 RepID=A0AAW0SIN7_SCYPA
MASTQRYTQEQVERAVELVRSKQMPLNGASKDFRIPYATLGDKRKRKIISKTGAKHLYSITSGTRQQVTMLAFSFAMGQYLPPLLIFPYTRDLRFNVLERFEEAFYQKKTPNGWITEVVFLTFLRDIFITKLGEKRPVVLEKTLQPAPQFVFHIPACPTVPAFHIPPCPIVPAFHMPKFQNDWRLPHTALIPEEKGIEKDHHSIAILNKWC